MIMIMIQNVKCRGYKSSPHLGPGSSLRGPGEFGGGRRQATEYVSASAKFAAAAGVVCGGFCVFCVFCVERLISHGTTLSVVRARTHAVSLSLLCCVHGTHIHTHAHIPTHTHTHTHFLSPPPFPPPHATNCSRVLFRRQGRSEYWSITLLVHEQLICV